jgi:hypothetical protein
MEPDKLRRLLYQQEGPTLDFKREWYKIDHSRQETKVRQRGELIKDVLALANGNAHVAGETAYLIIGADDKLNEDGERQLFSVPGPLPTASQIRDLVNSACEPAIENIWCTSVDLDGHRLLVITIPGSPYLYETTRKLKTPKSVYTEHVVFVRHNSSNQIASAKERATILERKNKAYAELRNAPPMIFGAGLGALILGPVSGSQIVKITGEERTRSTGFAVGAALGGLLGGLYGKVYEDLTDIKIDWPHMSTAERLLAVVVIGGPGLLALMAWQRIRRNH